MPNQTPTTYTRPDIDALLTRSDAAVERAIIVLFERQTDDEQSRASTNHQNNRGFASCDARAGTRFARWLQGMDDNNRKRFPIKSLNHPKAARIFRNYCKNGEGVIGRARRIAIKHSRQLVEIANGGPKPAQKIELSKVEKVIKDEKPYTPTFDEMQDSMGDDRLSKARRDVPDEPEHFPMQDSGPQPGTWAHTAKLMSSMDDDGFDWDAWKDEMKDKSLGL